MIGGCRVSLWRLITIKIQPDVIATPFGFPITNTLLCTWISIIVLVALFYAGTRRRDMIPRGMQNFMEWVVELLLGLVEGVSGKEKVKMFFPLVATFFIFILVSNLLDVFPGVDTVGSINLTAIRAAHITSQPVFGFRLFLYRSNCLLPLYRHWSSRYCPWSTWKLRQPVTRMVRKPSRKRSKNLSDRRRQNSKRGYINFIRMSCSSNCYSQIFFTAIA